MDELVQWLRAQLEAERAVQWHDLECEIHAHQDGGLRAAMATVEMLVKVPGAVCDCDGPARVLREIDAKRRLLALHHQLEDAQEMLDFCATCDATGKYPEYPCTTLRLLALPYAGRPGYREEWRP